MNKRILSIALSLALALSLTTSAMAATKPSTKSITFNAGTYYEEDLDNEATVKITNVTSQKKKDYSIYLSDDDVTIAGKDSKVVYCQTKTTITLQPNKDTDNAGVFAFYISYDSNKIKPSTVKSNIKYYSFTPETEEVDTSEKYASAPEDGWVVADGSSFSLTKAGTYALFVRPFQFYGTIEESFELSPMFIVVK